MGTGDRLGKPLFLEFERHELAGLEADFFRVQQPQFDLPHLMRGVRGARYFGGKVRQRPLPERRRFVSTDWTTTSVSDRSKNRRRFISSCNYFHLHPPQYPSVLRFHIHPPVAGVEPLLEGVSAVAAFPAP